MTTANLQEELWNRLKTVLHRHYYQPDVIGVRAVLSAVAAHRLNGDPVWPMLIGPPGSMKTELLNTLEGLPTIHLIDEVTPNTFISGQMNEGSKKRKSPASLLHRIGNDGIIVCADFSTIIEMRSENRSVILAQLRRIYDGSLRREFGHTDGQEERQWKGRLTFVCATTPDVDRHFGVFQSLGERFVQIRWDRPGGTEAAMMAMMQCRDDAKRELKQAVQLVLKNCGPAQSLISNEMLGQLAALSEVVVRARTHVPRNGFSKELTYKPISESATRLSIQLAQLSKGSAYIAGRREANEADYVVALRAGMDCIPALRRALIDSVIQGRPFSHGMPKTTYKQVLEDLQMVGLFSGDTLNASTITHLRTAGVCGEHEKSPPVEYYPSVPPENSCSIQQ